MKTIFVALQQLNLYITPFPLSQNYKTDKIEPINYRELSARETVELNPWLRDVKQRIRVYVGVIEILKNVFASTMLEKFYSEDKQLTKVLRLLWRLRLADVAFTLVKSVTEEMAQTVIQYMYMLI